MTTTISTGPATIVYLSRPQIAAKIGVQPDTLNRYKLPEPDAMIGVLPGWLEATIEDWNASRPGRGNWRSAAAAR